MQEEIKIIVLDSGRLEQFAHLIPDKLKDIIRESGTIILGAKGPGEVAMGVAVFSEYSHFMDLLWIYVEPEFRGFGIGKAFIHRMMTTLEDISYFRGVCVDYQRAENMELDYLLGDLGFFREEQDWSSYSFQLMDAKELERFTPSNSNRLNIKGLCRISDCSDMMKKNFSYKLAKSEESYPIELPVPWKRYDDGLSCVYVAEGEISAVLLIQTTKENIHIAFAYAKDNYYIFPYMMGYSFEKACKQYQDHTVEVTVTALEENAENLILKLVPAAKNRKIIHAQLNR